MDDQLLGVEGEVRRRDHGHRVGAGLGRVLGELDGVGGRLRAAVDGDLEPPGGRREEELGGALPLGDVEEDALARRAEGEDPVDSVTGEKVEVRPECVRVEVAASGERREGGGDRSSQHCDAL